MNMMDKFNCDIMNVNDMHEKQNDNFDTFEKEEMHLNMRFDVQPAHTESTP